MRRAPSVSLIVALFGVGLYAVFTLSSSRREPPPSSVPPPRSPGRNIGSASGRVPAPASPRTESSTRRITASELVGALCGAARAGSPAERETIYSQKLTAWVAGRPEHAGRIVDEIARESPEAARRLAAQLRAAGDFPAAYQWALRFDDPAQRPLLLASVLYQSECDAPQATLELAQETPLGEARELVLQTLAVQWAAEDYAAAVAWATAQPATPSRDGVFRALALARLAIDPPGAAHLILYAISPGPVQQEAVSVALENWPAIHHAKAAEWLRQFPDGALRRGAEATFTTRFAGSP